MWSMPAQARDSAREPLQRPYRRGPRVKCGWRRPRFAARHGLRLAPTLPMMRRMFASPHVLAGEEIADDVLRRVVTSILSRCKQPGGPLLDEVVHETIFAEQARLADTEDGGRAAADRQFVGWLRHE